MSLCRCLCLSVCVAGAGKTTVILNVILQLHALSPSSPVLWLKNEFGDLAVDSVLAAQSHLTVTEVLNGCICCTAVGKLSDALIESLSQYHPSRIFIESSGSAFPATLACELNRLQHTHHLPIRVETIICVVDMHNYSYYTDTSYTARLQAKYTDLLLLNKHESVPQEQQDKILDDLHTLNEHTPMIKTDRGKVDVALLIGTLSVSAYATLTEKDLVRINAEIGATAHHAGAQEHDHWQSEVSVLSLSIADPHRSWQYERLTQWLSTLFNTQFYRIKGMIALSSPAPHAHPPSSSSSTLPATTTTSSFSFSSSSSLFYVLNWSFGRFTLTALDEAVYRGSTRLTFMGDHDIALPKVIQQLRRTLQLTEQDQLYAVSGIHAH